MMRQIKIPAYLADVLGTGDATCRTLFEASGIRVSRYSNPKVSFKSFLPQLRPGYCLVLALSGEGSRKLHRLGTLIYSTPSERGAVDIFEMDQETELSFRPPFDYLVIEMEYGAHGDSQMTSLFYGHLKDSKLDHHLRGRVRP